MNSRGGAERFLAISDTADRRSEAETLIAKIADGLSMTGEYVARLDLQPTQAVVDFSWAARQAGRQLGVRVDISSQLIQADGRVRVVVTALTPPS